MFRLTADEFASLRSQVATSSSGHGGRRHAPHAFTEHGALMAASVLHTDRAVEVSLFVVRAFVHLRNQATTNVEVARRLDELKARTGALAQSHDQLGAALRAQLKQVFDALRALTTPPDPPRRPIGFIDPG